MDPDSLLDGFEVVDEDYREFLRSLIISGHVPKSDMDELVRLSLMRGVEEWTMVFECATAIRNNFLGLGDCRTHEYSLVPFLGLVLSGQADSFLQNYPKIEQGSSETSSKKSQRISVEGARRNGGTTGPKKRSLARTVSHFWTEPGQGDCLRETPRRAAASLPVPFEVPSCENRLASPSGCITNKEPSKAVGGVRELSALVPCPTVSQLADDTTPSVNHDETDLIHAPVQSSTKQEQPAAKAKRVHRSPFFSTPTSPEKKETGLSSKQPPSSAKKTRPARGTVSGLPIPPLSADHFGLIQEELAQDPFRLLVAITFLIRTSGKAAIPVFRELMDRFPTPEAIVGSNPTEITALIHPLGLSVVRTAKIQKYARLWLENPPCKDRRYVVKNYPGPGDGGHHPAGQEFGPEPDTQGDEVDAVTASRESALGCAWEIGHLTQGRYALDSWRIFCRDVLLGRAEDWKGKGRHSEFQPEWMRVLPEDKELRACLRWMWMREGWEWDHMTGEREPLREEMRRAVDEGRVGYDDHGSLVILDQISGSTVV